MTSINLPFDFPLTAKAPVTMALQGLGCVNFSDACSYVSRLPYYRNFDKNNVLCVLNEQCGTCSTKHMVLKKIAEEHAISDIHLVIGIFLMTPENTPKVKPILDAFNLSGIPEAHCYLANKGKIFDYTFEQVQIDFAGNLFVEYQVLAAEISIKKVKLHQTFLHKWAEENALPFSLQQLWQIREQCITALSL